MQLIDVNLIDVNIFFSRTQRLNMYVARLNTNALEEKAVGGRGIM